MTEIFTQMLSELLSNPLSTIAMVLVSFVAVFLGGRILMIATTSERINQNRRALELATEMFGVLAFRIAFPQSDDVNFFIALDEYKTKNELRVADGKTYIDERMWYALDKIEIKLRDSGIDIEFDDMVELMEGLYQRMKQEGLFDTAQEDTIEVS